MHHSQPAVKERIAEQMQQYRQQEGVKERIAEQQQQYRQEVMPKRRALRTGGGQAPPPGGPKNRYVDAAQWDIAKMFEYENI